jgi:imidazoleglycerol phosphate dehydratase HisB
MMAPSTLQPLDRMFMDFSIPDIPMPEQEAYFLDLCKRYNLHSEGGWDEVHIKRYKTHDMIHFVCHCANKEQMKLTMKTFVHNVPATSWIKLLTDFKLD